MTRAAGTLIVVASVTLSSLGHFSLKYGAIRIHWDRASSLLANIAGVLGIPALWVGVVLQGGALVLWVYALNTLELGFAYPFLALGYVLIVVLSIVVLGESWSLLRIGGMALIVAGVMLVARS